MTSYSKINPIPLEFHARISKIRGSKIGLDGTSWCPTRHRCARSVTYWQTWTNDSAQLEGSVGPANKAGMGHAIPSLEAGERGEHYHIMLVCNYKLSYPRVNPARYISLESTVSPRTDSSRSIPFGFHPLRDQPASIVEESTAGGPRSLVFSSIKREKWYDVTGRSDSIRFAWRTTSTNQTRLETLRARCVSVRNLFEPLARRNYFGILVEIGIWSLLISVNYSYVMYIRYQGVRF